MTRARTTSFLVFVIGLVLAAALPAAASGGSAGTLNIDNTLDTTPWQTASCPPGTPGANPHCYTISGEGVVPGLGQTTEAYAYSIDDATSSSSHARVTATISVSGKGTIAVSAVSPQPVCSCGEATLAYTITGGTGVFAGASGTGTTTLTAAAKHAYWSGTLTVAGYTFDTSPPVISGAKAKTVKAPKGAKRVRVKYTVTATDAGSGPVPVTCKPRSGSRFRIGHTTVQCAASDAAGNTATAHFRVTVKRR